jgi:hypothetical protein
MELKFASVDEAIQHLAKIEGKKVVIAAPVAPSPVKKPGQKPITTPSKPGQTPGKQPRTIPMPQPKNFAARELRFASEDEALQYFAGMLNTKVVIGRS